MSQIKIKQLLGNTTGSILFSGNNSVVSEDFNNLNWDINNNIFNINGNVEIKNSLLSNQELTTTVSDTYNIASVLISDYDGVFFDFVIKKGLNIRAGTVYSVHDGTNVEFTETSTNDLGDTSDVLLDVIISDTDIVLQATTLSDNWILKTLIRGI